MHSTLHKLDAGGAQVKKLNVHKQCNVRLFLHNWFPKVKLQSNKIIILWFICLADLVFLWFVLFQEPLSMSPLLVYWSLWLLNFPCTTWPRFYSTNAPKPLLLVNQQPANYIFYAHIQLTLCNKHTSSLYHALRTKAFSGTVENKCFFPQSTNQTDLL